MKKPMTTATHSLIPQTQTYPDNKELNTKIIPQSAAWNIQHSFNQSTFMSDLNQSISNILQAINKGCCTVFSAYFIKLALINPDINFIMTEFFKDKFSIADLQATFVNIFHINKLDSYLTVLQTLGLRFSGNEYKDPASHLQPGSTALCLLEYPNMAHMLAILYSNDGQLFVFDPNFGILNFSSAYNWYHGGLHSFINTNYGTGANITFVNVASAHY